MKKLGNLLGLLLVALLLQGCYFFKEVQTSEVGLQLDDGVSISDVVDAGRYSDGSWYADLVVIDVSTITTEWSDASLVTSDKQPISLKLALTFNRSRLESDIENLYNDYRTEALDNEALKILVHSRVPSVAKAITTKYTLDQMLGIEEGEDAVGREVVENELQALLTAELAEIGVELRNAAIADIGVDQSFLDALTDKARAQIESEIAIARTAQLEQQLLQEQAQTEIDLEIARRTNAVNEELAQAYRLNPELFELEKLRILAGLLDANDLVIYVPQGSDITSVLSGQPGVVPVPDNE